MASTYQEILNSIKEYYNIGFKLDKLEINNGTCQSGDLVTFMNPDEFANEKIESNSDSNILLVLDIYNVFSNYNGKKEIVMIFYSLKDSKYYRTLDYQKYYKLDLDYAYFARSAKNHS